MSQQIAAPDGLRGGPLGQRHPAAAGVPGPGVGLRLPPLRRDHPLPVAGVQHLEAVPLSGLAIHHRRLRLGVHCRRGIQGRLVMMTHFGNILSNDML